MYLFCQRHLLDLHHTSISSCPLRPNLPGNKWFSREGKRGDSLHDIIDVLSEDIEGIRINIGISDKWSKVDYKSILLSHTTGKVECASQHRSRPTTNQRGTHQIVSIDVQPHKSRSLVYRDSLSFARRIEPFQIDRVDCFQVLYRNRV